MGQSSARRRDPSTQESIANGKKPLARIADRVSVRVENVRRALVNGAPHGFATELAAEMGWRVERRSRELNSRDLSLAGVAGEIELHLKRGEQEAVDAILAALLDGLRSSAVPITPGSVIRVFDEGRATLHAVRPMSAPLISISEAAGLLGVGWDFVARRKVEFRAVRTGRTYGIPPEAVGEFKASHAVTVEKRTFPKVVRLSRREMAGRRRELARTARSGFGIGGRA